MILSGGEPHFIGKQVATILGYSNTNDAIIKHVDAEDKLTSQIAMSGQNRNVTLINESGLYSLILSSKLETAKRFKRWVTSEVLPTIRKTGKYDISETPEQLIARTLVFANKMIDDQSSKIAVLTPKAIKYDTCIENFKCINWRDLCNEIRDTCGVTESEIRKKLVAEGWIYRRCDFGGKSYYRPYKETIDRHLMIVKDTLCNDGEVRPCNYFTYKGREQIIDWFVPRVIVENVAFDN